MAAAPKKHRARTIHVFHNNGGWSVRREGTKQGGDFRKRADAIAAARRIMLKAAPAQVVVHTKDDRVASIERRGIPAPPSLPDRSSIGRGNIQRAVFSIVRERLLADSL